MSQQYDSDKLSNVQALEMVIDLEEFTGSDTRYHAHSDKQDLKGLFTPFFRGKSFKAKIANFASKPLVKIIRKSVATDYILRQQQVNLELRREIEGLRIQINKLRDDVRRSK